MTRKKTVRVPLKFLALSLLVASLPSSLRAQAKPSSHDMEVSLTYTTLRSLKAASNQNFWQQGGSIEVSGTMWKGLAMTADISGSHAASIGSSGIPISLITTTFGPRYRFLRDRKLSMYGQGLVGIANSFDSILPASGAADSSASSMALQVNGGVDLRIKRHVSLRLIDAGWTRTQLPNAASNVQNNVRLGAGIVFRTGH